MENNQTPSECKHCKDCKYFQQYSKEEPLCFNFKRYPPNGCLVSPKGEICPDYQPKEKKDNGRR